MVGMMSAACTQLIAPSTAFLMTSCLVMALLSRDTCDAIRSTRPVYRHPLKADIFECSWGGHLECSLQVESGGLTESNVAYT